ncbi:MAG: T9SS type A sorting domain-containing protein, partial [Candidatus Bathyarchaeota archaeon]|nr:T9SS type A sorting domain-containing protein [Candidatus Bathyarchaeota archaeon]
SIVSTHPKISWEAVSEPDIANYKIYRKYYINKYSTYSLIATVGSTTTSYTDPNAGYAFDGNNIYYYVKARDSYPQDGIASTTVSTKGFIGIDSEGGGSEQIATLGKALPTKYALKQAYPNPFNPETTIAFDLPEHGNVKIDVYSITGSLVGTLVDEALPAGCHQLQFNGAELSSGVYLIRMSADNFQQTQRIVLMK